MSEKKTYYLKGERCVLRGMERYDYRKDEWVEDIDSWFHSVGNSNDADEITEEEARKIIEGNGGKNFDRQQNIEEEK